MNAPGNTRAKQASASLCWERSGWKARPCQRKRVLHEREDVSSFQSLPLLSLCTFPLSNMPCETRASWREVSVWWPGSALLGSGRRGVCVSKINHSLLGCEELRAEGANIAASMRTILNKPASQPLPDPSFFIHALAFLSTIIAVSFVPAFATLLWWRTISI